MVRGIETAAAGMVSIMNLNDIIANNLANINTAGFKQLIPAFKNINEVNLKQKNSENSSEMYKNIGKLSTGSAIDATVLDLKQGALRQTGNKLDFAINGEGFFAIGTEQGERYTRNGSFSLDTQGNLITKDGLPVLGEDDKAIKLDVNNADPKDVTVSEDGRVYLNKQEFGKLKIVEFEKTTDLKTIGNGLFEPIGEDVKPKDNPNSKIAQGYIEASNANAIENMINTISANRTYETLSKVVQSSNRTLEKAVTDVGRVRE